MGNLRIRVAVGVLVNHKGQVLVGQRTVKDAYFQKWEFPGGKIEASESVDQALARELLEEIGVTVLGSSPLVVLKHDYPDRQVELSVRRVTEYEGHPMPLEGQAIKWVAIEDLSKLDFLAGNQPIIDALQIDSTLRVGN